jgi:hypothetical protein
MTHLSLIAIVFSVLLTCEAFADDWGIGFSIGSAPSVSLQQRFSRTDASHYQAHYSEDALVTSYDYQRFIGQRFSFLPSLTEFYSGFGLTGEARKEQGTKETFHGKIPIGMQWTSAKLRISAFVEGVARMGPIPKTTITGVATGGIRTIF